MLKLRSIMRHKLETTMAAERKKNVKPIYVCVLNSVFKKTKSGKWTLFDLRSDHRMVLSSKSDRKQKATKTAITSKERFTNCIQYIRRTKPKTIQIDDDTRKLVERRRTLNK